MIPEELAKRALEQILQLTMSKDFPWQKASAEKGELYLSQHGTMIYKLVYFPSQFADDRIDLLLSDQRNSSSYALASASEDDEEEYAPLERLLFEVRRQLNVNNIRSFADELISLLPEGEKDKWKSGAR